MAQQGAHSEAVGYLTRSIEVLQQLPDGNDRDRQELNLQIALGRSLIVVKGWSAPEREPVLLRAQELADRVKDDSKLTETLLALAYFACTIANPASRGSSRSALWLWPTKPRRKP
jgi:hypothetical protein